VITHQLTHVQASFWLGIEERSIRRRNLVPDESGPRSAWHTHQKPEPENGACAMGII